MKGVEQARGLGKRLKEAISSSESNKSNIELNNDINTTCELWVSPILRAIETAYCGFLETKLFDDFKLVPEMREYGFLEAASLTGSTVQEILENHINTNLVDPVSGVSNCSSINVSKESGQSKFDFRSILTDERLNRCVRDWDEFEFLELKERYMKTGSSSVNNSSVNSNSSNTAAAKSPSRSRYSAGANTNSSSRTPNSSRSSQQQSNVGTSSTNLNSPTSKSNSNSSRKYYSLDSEAQSWSRRDPSKQIKAFLPFKDFWNKVAKNQFHIHDPFRMSDFLGLALEKAPLTVFCVCHFATINLFVNLFGTDFDRNSWGPGPRTAMPTQVPGSPSKSSPSGPGLKSPKGPGSGPGKGKITGNNQNLGPSPKLISIEPSLMILAGQPMKRRMLLNCCMVEVKIYEEI